MDKVCVCAFYLLCMPLKHNSMFMLATMSLHSIVIVVVVVVVVLVQFSTSSFVVLILKFACFVAIDFKTHWSLVWSEKFCCVESSLIFMYILD